MTTYHYEEQRFAGGVANSVAAALTAAGTNLATALALTSNVNRVSTAASGTGVALPSATPVGGVVTVQNLGANDLKVYPPDASTSINGAANGVGLTLTTAARQIGEFRRLTATAWMATVSAGPQT
ncbi:hypothetical protein EP7_004333 [Isosphaeraceae bacterium EP7]